MRPTRWFIVVVALAALALRPARVLQADDKTATPVLQLANGDYIAGELADSPEANVIFWKCRAATEPFQFPLATLSVAHFPQHGDVPKVDAEFSLELAGGDVLHGTLVGMTDQAIDIESPRFGRLRIDRPQVHRLVRQGELGGVQYAGPDGLAGWNEEIQDAERVWSEEAGHLIADKPGAIILPTCHIPPRASIEIELSWKNKGDFSIAFGGGQAEMDAQVVRALRRIANPQPAPAAQQNKPPESMFALEVWNRSLVLVRERSEADLDRIVNLAAGAGRIQLRLFYDQESGRVAVYSVEGRLMAEVEVPDKGPVLNRGIRLVNKQGDVRLEQLVVRQWVGDLPAEVEANRSYVQRTDGTVHYADSPQFDAASKEFVLAADGKETRIAAADVDRIVMGEPAQLEGAIVRAALYDGTRVSGQLQKVESGRVHLARTGLDGVLELPIADLRSLASLSDEDPGEAPVGRMGRFEAEGVRVRGVLADGESSDAASCVAWRPLGSRNSSPLAKGASGRIIYRDLPKQEPNVDQQAIEQQQAARARRVVVRPAGVFGVLQAFGGGRDAEAEATTAVQSRGQLLWLRGGDRIPCELESIDERGVTFKSNVIDSTFLPHDSVQAWERFGGSQPQLVDAKKRERLLTLPRMQRDNPPTHLIESRGGDFLRGRLNSLDADSLSVEVRLESKDVARDRVIRIIWLEKPPQANDDDAADDDKPAEAADEGPAEADPAAVAAADAPPDEATKMQAVRRDGVRLTFTPERSAEQLISGTSRLLGACQVKVSDVDQLLLGGDIDAAAADLLYASWQLKPAPDPRYLTEDSSEGGGPPGADASLAGAPAPDFELDLLAGGKLKLADQRGKIVVLDFWASWCGPCMQAMPMLDAVAEELGGDDVKFFAVNLQEDRQTVEDAIERLNVGNAAVALDVDGATAEKYGVRAIPQTVVIDREGKVASVLIGGRPDYADQLRQAIEAADPKAEAAGAGS